jgi:hypothetical protein
MTEAAVSAELAAAPPVQPVAAARGQHQAPARWTSSSSATRCRRPEQWGPASPWARRVPLTSAAAAQMCNVSRETWETPAQVSAAPTCDP